MPSPINKEVLDHLTKLAYLKLDPEEEEKLLTDLQKILDYFEELKSLDTENVEPMRGGSSLINSFRDDASRESTNKGEGKDQFPEKNGDFLVVPPVFE